MAGRLELKVWTQDFSHRIDGKGKLIDKANDYFEAGEVNGLSPDTLRTYAYTLMAFFKWFGTKVTEFEKFFF